MVPPGSKQSPSSLQGWSCPPALLPPPPLVGCSYLTSIRYVYIYTHFLEDMVGIYMQMCIYKKNHLFDHVVFTVEKDSVSLQITGSEACLPVDFICLQ